MVHREAFTRLCTATIQDKNTGKTLHTLAITVSPPISGKSGHPYRKVRALDADGTPYYGYV
jgi:hypothetical protein